MKKLTLLLACILCVSILCTACQIGDENPSVHLGSGTTPDTGSTDPSTPETEITDPSTPETEVTEPSVPETESSEPSTPETEPPAPTDPDTGLPVYVPGSIELFERDAGDLAPVDREYRLCYYIISGAFMNLVMADRPEEFGEWTRMMEISTNYGEHYEEMLLVSYIKYFNIPREDFDRALEQHIQLHAQSLTNEFREPPNGDIIYTFDNEIINHYYRYE